MAQWVEQWDVMQPITQGLKITEEKVLPCNYIHIWLDFQVFSE